MTLRFTRTSSHDGILVLFFCNFIFNILHSHKLHIPLNSPFWLHRGVRHIFQNSPHFPRRQLPWRRRIFSVHHNPLVRLGPI
ncbi:hypothetical protein BC829DRAFT_389050, partial [Chytridium lagenaria]